MYAHLLASTSTPPPSTRSLPHAQVRKAAEKAFDQIGSIIANPEIKPLVPALLLAVQDSTKYTQDALEKLTHTSFAYAVDSPSLALLMPIVFAGYATHAHAHARVHAPAAKV